MKHSKGIFYVLMAAVLFSIGGLCIKLIPWSPLSINGARNFISVIIIGAYLKATHHKIVINPAVIFGAVCMTGVTTLYCIANKLTTAANTIVLQFTAPIFVIFLMWILKKEITIVIVTHNMQQATRIADKTAFFLLGELVEYGNTDDIFTSPKDERTERYITGRFG